MPFYGPWRPSWIVNLHKFDIVLFKNKKNVSYKKHSDIKLPEFQPLVLEVFSFLCLFYFSNGFGGYLGRSFLFNFETTQCKNHLTQSWSKSIQP